MKWYLGGPMTGLPNYNFDEFERVAKILRADGLEIVSAHEIDHGETLENIGTTKTYGEYLKTAVGVLSTCDGAIFLEGWNNSKGARLEYKIARDCEMSVKFYAYERLGNVPGA